MRLAAHYRKSVVALRGRLGGNHGNRLVKRREADCCCRAGERGVSWGRVVTGPRPLPPPSAAAPRLAVRGSPPAHSPKAEGLRGAEAGADGGVLLGIFTPIILGAEYQNYYLLPPTYSTVEPGAGRILLSMCLRVPG